MHNSNLVKFAKELEDHTEWLRKLSELEGDTPLGKLARRKCVEVCELGLVVRDNNFDKLTKLPFGIGE